MITKPKRKRTRAHSLIATRKALPIRPFTWCEHDLIGTFLIEHKQKFQEHIVSFGYTEGEARLMRHHIADKIFNHMFYTDPNTNRERHTP